ncbi:MAG TPA: TonB-dependent receptor plug domain-containing protein, partial [Devosia sp.]|nr:TonB-dependent receptor plug domain-containing protein [Devosia sp.]
MAQAQDLPEGENAPENLPEVVAEGEQIATPARLGSGVNSGTTIIERQDIQLRSPGSGDVNELLRILPTVQFDRNDTVASQDNIQDIRPANIAISGGHYYANNISLDGVNINSRLDVTNDNPQNGSEVAGPSAQTHWLDSELIGKITVFDSNVSAEYGDFTGGAVTIETRDPGRTFGVTATASHTSDQVTSFRLSSAAREQFEGSDLPATPEFEKWRYGGTVDIPLSDRAAVLVAYNHSESRVTHFANSKYGNAQRRFRDISDNVLVKGVFDIDNATVLRGQFAYSPYSSTSSTDAAVDAVVDSKGGGITSKLEIEHTGSFDWKVEGSYVYTDTSRTAPEVQYNIPNTTANGAFCASSTCTTGGIGDLDQTQRIYTLKATMGAELGDLALRGGVDYEHVAARKARPEDVFAYSRGKLASNIVCVDGDSLDCTTGEYALEQYNYNKAYNARVSLDSAGAWLEGALETGALTLRGGLRYDYESFLGNHVLAPRFAAAYRLPWNDIEIS